MFCSGHRSFTIGCAQNVQAHMRGPIIRREWFTISWGWFTISWDMHQVSVTKGGRGECVHQRGTVGTQNLCHKASKGGDRRLRADCHHYCVAESSLGITAA